jgi:hypothetical protein
MIFRHIACLMTVVILASCSGVIPKNGPSPGENSEPARTAGAVRIVGDTPEQVRRGIEAAEAAHKYPIFLGLFAAKRLHVLPTSAQIVRVGSNIAVRAYFKVYVYASRSVKLVVGSSNGPKIFELADLPKASASDLMGLMHIPASNEEKRLCADCAAVVSSLPSYLRILEKWHSITDPWASGEQSALPIEDVQVPESIRPGYARTRNAVTVCIRETMEVVAAGAAA